MHQFLAKSGRLTRLSPRLIGCLIVRQHLLAIQAERSIIVGMRRRLRYGTAQLLWGLLAAIPAWLLVSGLAGPLDPAASINARVQTVTRGLDFDLVGWTAQAVWAKLLQASSGEQLFMTEADRSDLVRDYFINRQALDDIEGQIATRFADPALADPLAATADLRAEQTALRARLAELAPLAEAILAEQVSTIAAEEGLTVLGQPIPPVSFQFTPLPLALIVSPRERIEQSWLQLVDGALTLDAQVALEDTTTERLDVSALASAVGGLGTYPTMVAQHSDLYWIASVVAHEWIHNYLTLRPLGLRYLESPELRTMNETTATLIGDEIGSRVIERYYPELARPATFATVLRRDVTVAPDAPRRFDFRAEMRATRLRVDALLAEGQIGEAETYMEARRAVFWDNGYRIRKLNQAYFAFYGAYAPSAGGGAGGADPVGPAVILLRRRSASIHDFLEHMAWVSDIDTLRAELGLPPR